MLYVLFVMVLIFGVIFAIQYKLAIDSGKVDMKNILETTVLWSVISYLVLGIIVFGVSFITTLD